MKRIAMTVVGLCLAATLMAQSTIDPGGKNSTFTLTGYPHTAAVVTPNDGTDLANPGYVRADEAGAVRVTCFRNAPANHTTFTLAAGEFVPCLVKRVWDTGTANITLHVLY